MINKQLKALLRNSFTTTCFGAQKLIGQSNTKGRILTYHRVNSIPGDRLSVTAEMFDQQMEWLANQGLRGVSMKQWFEQNCPDDCVVLTFDDGYEDNYAQAFPILLKYGFTATVYVITSLVGSDKTIDRYEGRESREFMTWDEVKELSRQNIEIGSHTVNHPRLTQVSEEEAAREMKDAKETIESKLGKACESFCYPGGMWNEKLEELVRSAGYDNACTVNPGSNESVSGKYRLKRTEVSGEDTLFDFEKKLSGAFDAWHGFWQAGGNLK